MNETAIDTRNVACAIAFANALEALLSCDHPIGLIHAVWCSPRFLSSNHDSFRFSFDLFVAICAQNMERFSAPTFGDLLASKMPPERINTLKWESNGELSAHDVFELVKRLKHEEQPARSSQLLQLVNKHRHSSKAKKPAPRAAS